MIKQFKSLLKEFRRSRLGATAIESAFIIPIFFAIVFSCFEVGNVFFKQSVIEQAAHDAARQVRVGRAVAADYLNESPAPGQCSTGRECFYDEVCNALDMFGDCDQRLSIEVRQFEDFADLNANGADAMTCPNSPEYVFDAQPYEPGNRNEVIRVRICYLINTFNPAVGVNLKDNDDGTKSIVAIAIHRNEPYLDEDDINPNDCLDGDSDCNDI
ncbi:MAG: TadE/TadG family type IV pilus assembly protein [Pseudomonadota bacterium]